MNEEVIYSIARAYSFIDQDISHFLTQHNLTPAKFNILLTVKHEGKDKGIAQNKISRLLLVTISNISRMIDKLEKDGYVQRLAKAGDRRVNLIMITRNGSVLLDEIWPYYTERVNNLVSSHFSDLEKQKIINLLQRLQKKE
jgi:DNA-binding MarR family transcriptional regulator